MCRIDVMLTWHLLICAREGESSLGRKIFKTELSLWKDVKCLPSTLLRRRKQSPVTATITGQFCICAFVFEENSGRGILWLLLCHRLRKASFSNCLPCTPKRKTSLFSFLRIEERIRKAPFSWRISVDRRPNPRNKAPFSKSPAIVWTGPHNYDSWDFYRGLRKTASCTIPATVFLAMLMAFKTALFTCLCLLCLFFFSSHLTWRNSINLHSVCTRFGATRQFKAS